MTSCNTVLTGAIANKLIGDVPEQSLQSYSDIYAVLISDSFMNNCSRHAFTESGRLMGNMHAASDVIAAQVIALGCHINCGAHH